MHMQMLKQMQIQMQLRMRIQIQVVKLWQSLEKTAAFASRSALLENSKVVQFSASSPHRKSKDKYENKYNCKKNSKNTNKNMEDQIMIFAVDMEAALWKTLTNR